MLDTLSPSSDVADSGSSIYLVRSHFHQDSSALDLPSFLRMYLLIFKSVRPLEIVAIASIALRSLLNSSVRRWLPRRSALSARI